jgi:hypothetical protein
MLILSEYIKLPLENRKKHLDVNTPCLERGGFSTKFQGVLAEFLNTTLPENRYIILCHSCNNSKCSNPKHIYWGTHKENLNDSVNAGSHQNIWERTIKKYGLEETKKMWGKRGKKTGLKNKGKKRNKINKNSGTPD